MFNADNKKHKNNDAEILPEERATSSGRRIISDIISRGRTHPPKIVVPVGFAEKKPVILPDEPKEEYEPPQPKLALHKTGGNNITPAPESRGRRSMVWRFISRPFAVSSIISIFVLLSAVWSISTYFSNFAVTISPKTELTDIADIPVLVDTKSSRPNFVSNVLPGEILELTGSEEAEFKSTGQKNIEDRARGIIKIYNAFSSSPQKLVATTRLIDGSGKIFRLVKNITVPGAVIENGKIKPSSIEAEAEANSAGEEFNIGQSRFKIPGFEGTAKYDTFYGESKKDFSGGSRGLATVISDDDIKKAAESVTAKLFNNLKNDLTKKIPQGLHLLESFKEIAIENVKAPQKGLKQETFKIETKGKARAIVFRDKDLEDLAKTAILAKMPDKNLIEGSFTPIFKNPEVKFDKGTAQFIVAGSAKLQSKIEVDKIQAFILGKKIGTIEEFLKKNATISSFQFKSFPFWNLKAPSDYKKINIFVK